MLSPIRDQENHPTPAEPLDLDAILERRAAAQRWHGGPHHGLNLYAKSSDDVPVLLAALMRERAALADHLERQAPVTEEIEPSG